MTNRRTFVDYSLNQIEFEALCWGAMLHLSKCCDTHTWTKFGNVLNKEFGIDFKKNNAAERKFNTWYLKRVLHYKKVRHNVYTFNEVSPLTLIVRRALSPFNPK